MQGIHSGRGGIRTPVLQPNHTEDYTLSQIRDRFALGNRT